MNPAGTFLTLSPERRRVAFIQAATEKQIEAAIIEKDFWVCWLLGVIFSDPDLGPHFVFKGGTSLSKVYNVIDRFSEDVDLGIAPAYLGLSEDVFEALTSRTSRDGALAEMQRACGEKLEKTIAPRLEKSIRSVLGNPPSGGNWLTYVFDDRVHSPIVYFTYPTELPEGIGYIRRDVKLEIGSLTDQRPIGVHGVRPWLAEAFPIVFSDWHCEVTALELARTFWEKATILHAEHHRPDGHDMPVRHARHYSDFARLLAHPEAEAFLADRAMCLRVANWKSRVFARKWACYDLARHGTFSIVPPKRRLENLEKDYVAMRPMFLAEPQTFEDMMATLAEGEKRINSI